jgi:hypothetical protein
MIATFSGLGVRFQYPGNWQVSQDGDCDFPLSVSVHSPTGAFCSIAIYPLDEDPHQAARRFSETLLEEYEDIEVFEVTPHEADNRVDGEFELNFYCLDFLITARIVGFRTTQHTLVILSQAESREFDDLQPVFQAIQKSMFDLIEDQRTS